MALRQLHRLIHTATRSSRAHHAACHARLRLQIAKGDVNVGGPLFLHNFVGFLWRRHLVRAFAAALTVAAKIHSQYVEPRSSELCGKIVPNFALAIALMQQQNARPKLRCGEIRSLKSYVTRRGEIHHARRRYCLCRARQRQRERNEQCEKENPEPSVAVDHGYLPGFPYFRHPARWNCKRRCAAANLRSSRVSSREQE